MPRKKKNSHDALIGLMITNVETKPKDGLLILHLDHDKLLVINAGSYALATKGEKVKAIIDVIRTEKLKLLDRLSSHQEDLFWWTGGEYEKTKAIDMRAIADEREQLTKLEAEL